MAEMDHDVRPSLFVKGTINTNTGWSVGPNAPPVRYGSVNDVGFGTSWSSSLSECPPRKEGFLGKFYTDRFFGVTSSKKQKVLARIEIKEAPVYDEQYRCPIDFTGFQVMVTLHEEAFGPFLDYVGLPDPDSKDLFERSFRNFALRVPSVAFPFPEPRGGPAPYDPVGKCVTDLKMIREFEVDDLMVAKFDMRWIDTKPLPGYSLRERYGIESGLRLSLSNRW